jgi:hypothetical protein
LFLIQKKSQNIVFIPAFHCLDASIFWSQGRKWDLASGGEMSSSARAGTVVLWMEIAGPLSFSVAKGSTV